MKYCFKNTGNPACYSPPECSPLDGNDDDGDGFVDAADPGCTDGTELPRNAHMCENGADDDGDGLVDLEDPSCANGNDSEKWNNKGYLQCGPVDFDNFVITRKSHHGKNPSYPFEYWGKPYASGPEFGVPGYVHTPVQIEGEPLHGGNETDTRSPGIADHTNDSFTYHTGDYYGSNNSDTAEQDGDEPSRGASPDYDRASAKYSFAQPIPSGSTVKTKFEVAMQWPEDSDSENEFGQVTIHVTFYNKYGAMSSVSKDYTVLATSDNSPEQSYDQRIYDNKYKNNYNFSGATNVHQYYVGTVYPTFIFTNVEGAIGMKIRVTAWSADDRDDAGNWLGGEEGDYEGDADIWAGLDSMSISGSNICPKNYAPVAVPDGKTGAPVVVKKKGKTKLAVINNKFKGKRSGHKNDYDRNNHDGIDGNHDGKDWDQNLTIVAVKNIGPVYGQTNIVKHGKAIQYDPLNSKNPTIDKIKYRITDGRAKSGWATVIINATTDNHTYTVSAKDADGHGINAAIDIKLSSDQDRSGTYNPESSDDYLLPSGNGLFLGGDGTREFTIGLEKQPKLIRITDFDAPKGYKIAKNSAGHFKIFKQTETNKNFTGKQTTAVMGTDFIARYVRAAFTFYGNNGNSRITPGETITFNGGSSSSNGPKIANYRWHFPNGKGIVAYGQVAFDSFDSPGSYPVKLTVSNADGSKADSVARTVVVGTNSGPNVNITYHGIDHGDDGSQSAIFTVTASDPDGISSYDWAVASGPAFSPGGRKRYAYCMIKPRSGHSIEGIARALTQGGRVNCSFKVTVTDGAGKSTTARTIGLSATCQDNTGLAGVAACTGLSNPTGGSNEPGPGGSNNPPYGGGGPVDQCPTSPYDNTIPCQLPRH